MADPLEKQLGIALQRFERGDLVVRLSSVVNDILILPTSLLIEKSKWFEAALTRWQEPALAKGACVLTYQLGLTYHADLQSWSLSSRSETVKPRCSTANGIRKLYTTQFPARTNETNHRGVPDAHRASIQAHKMLFALVFELRIGFAEVSEVASLIADVLVLAEFYQLMPLLSDSIEKTLKTQWNIDGDVVENLAFYLSISEMLQSRVLFEEAMRHFVGSGQYRIKERHLNPLTSCLAYQKAFELQERLLELKRAIETIDLQLPAPFLIPDSNRGRGPKQEAIFLARALFLDWLSAESPRPVDIMTSAGCTFYSRLHQHGLFDDITFLGTKLCRKVLEAYHPKSYKATEQFTWSLHEYVRRASRLIGEMQYSMATPAARTQAVMSVYFTNMAFNDGEMPWEKDEAEDRAPDNSEELNELSIWEQSSSFPGVRRWLDAYECLDGQISEPKVLEYDQQFGWVMPCHPLAKPASDTWLKIIGFAHLAGI